MALGDDVSMDEVTAPNFDIRLPLPPGAKAPTSTTTPWLPEWTRTEVRIVVEGRAGLLNTGRLFCTTRPTPGRSTLCTAQSRHCKDMGFGVGLGGLVVITAGQ